jgi:hypothetical protein
VTRHDGTARTVPDAAERPRMRRKLRRTGRPFRISGRTHEKQGGTGLLTAEKARSRGIISLDLAYTSSASSRLLESTDLIGETMPCGLPRDAKCNRDAVPAPPAGAGSCYSFGDRGFISPDLIGSLGDGSQIREVIGHHSGRVEVLRQSLEAASGLCDLSVCVLHLGSPLSDELIELRAQPHGVDHNWILAA